MFEIFPVKCRRISENGGGFLKGDAVFLQVRKGFAFVPRKHINVYTLIWGSASNVCFLCSCHGNESPTIWTFQVWTLSRRWLLWVDDAGSTA
jgi:hypothetical protein